MKPAILHFALIPLLACSPLLAAEIIPASQPAAAADSPAREAVAAYRDGRRGAAVELARPLAENGDPDALFLMGFSFESLHEPARKSRGQAMDYYYRRAEAAGNSEAGLRRNLILLVAGKEEERKKGVEALESATKAGDPRGSRILGEAWLRGLVDGKPDPAKAVAYWKAAAEAGDVPSLVLLGQLLGGTFGFPEVKDAKASAGYLHKAAELGNKDAFIPLATLLLKGEDITRDEAEGARWIAKASEAGDGSGWQVMGEYQAGVKKDEKGAMESFRKGAEAGQPDCMFHMAQGSTDSHDWLKKAADAGDPEAAAELGHRMLDGSPAEKTIAVRYLLLAANENLPKAQYDLGLAYLEGAGCPRDPLAAMTWLTEAMKSGDAESQYKLATLHEQGIGGPVNYANAGVLYTMACSKGHAGAAARIAHMAAEGLGTERSAVQAWAHAVIAKERGNNSAEELRLSLEGKLSAAERAEGEKALADLRADTATLPAQGQK